MVCGQRKKVNYSVFSQSSGRGALEKLQHIYNECINKIRSKGEMCVEKVSM